MMNNIQLTHAFQQVMSPVSVVVSQVTHSQPIPHKKPCKSRKAVKKDQKPHLPGHDHRSLSSKILLPPRTEKHRDQSLIQYLKTQTLLSSLCDAPLQIEATMSDVREAQTKPLIILKNAEDYPNWKSHITSKLQQQNCEWAITERATPNLESVKANLILDGFAASRSKT